MIKDTPFDILALKSKRRYEINKGNKNFVVTEINPIEYAEELFNVAKSAWETYPASYRPKILHNKYVDEVITWDFYRVYGAFSTADHKLSGYALLRKQNGYIDFCGLKAIPERERLGVNAALVYKVLVDQEKFLKGSGYICDGQRNILHETAFQNYLEKYFGFRKAYCTLHIKYNPKYRIIIDTAYPMRSFFQKYEKKKRIGQLSALLRMEEINRNQVIL